MITREDVYKLVWSEPMTKVAQRFGVSGSYMARICTLLNVPRPERGHWAKLAVGKAESPRPLPAARPGDQIIWFRTGDLTSPPKAPSAPKRQSGVPVRIPRTRVHGLIRDAKAHFENGRPVDSGAYLKPYKKLLVDVTASEAALSATLGLANDLFNALHSVGHRVVIASSDSQLRRARIDEREARSTQRNHYHHNGLWSPQRPTVVYVGTVAIGLAIVEMSAEVLLRYVNGNYIRDTDYIPARSGRYTHDHTWTTTRELPSGRFRIIAYSPYSRVDWAVDWQDGPRNSLSSSLRSIVRAIEQAAPEFVCKLEEAERRADIANQEWLAAQEMRRREEDRQQVEQSIVASQQHLADVIQEWTKVINLEKFFSGVDQRVDELPDTERAAVLERLRLAREFVGSQDPLDFFLKWKTPNERYRPRYAEEASN